MIRYVAASCVAILLAFTTSGVPASGQVVTVYSPPVLAPQPVIAPVQLPYTVWSPPVVTAPVQQSYSVPITSAPVVAPVQRSYSVPITPAPVQQSFSVPVTSAPVLAPAVAPAPQSVIITPRAFVPGQPVRNVLRAMAQ